MPGNDSKCSCAIVGAGIAGLTAARRLRNRGIDAVVVEREDFVGGRMSTRRFAGGVFDDGAQFFTVKDPRFGAMVDRWITAGVVTDWFHSHLIRGGESAPDGYPRYCGIKGMRAITEHLAQGLDLRTGFAVSEVKREKHGWELTAEGGRKVKGVALLLTAPIPESLALLETGGVELGDNPLSSLQAVEYTPCITVLAAIDGPSGLTEWGGLRISGEYIDWIADNRRKGISPDVWAITIQAMPEFSREHWDDDDEQVAGLLLDNAKALILAEVREAKVFRWNLSKPLNPHPDPFVSASEDPLCLLAGDGFRGHRVEGAVMSGLDAAEEILKRM